VEGELKGEIGDPLPNVEFDSFEEAQWWCAEQKMLHPELEY